MLREIHNDTIVIGVYKMIEKIIGTGSRYHIYKARTEEFYMFFKLSGYVNRSHNTLVKLIFCQSKTVDVKQPC